MAHDLPWPSPTATALYAYDGRLTPELLHGLLNVHGAPVRHPVQGWRPGTEGPPGLEAGTPWSQQQVRERVQGILEGERWSIPIIPPGGPAVGGQAGEPPLFEVHGFNSLPVSHTFEDGRPDVPFAVFNPPKLPYLYLQMLNDSSNRFDVRIRRESDRFLLTARSIARLLRPSFVAIDDLAAFEGPDLHDPRSRAWGVTYYGPDLVESLGGRGALRASPAWQVEEDAGGFWVHLDEMPFVDSGQRAARREAVEEHLDLVGRFPNHA